MKIKTPTAVISILIMLISASCNEKRSATSAGETDSATIQTSEDKNKDNTFSSNQYANDSTITRFDTATRDASTTYPSNQYSSDSNVIKK